MTKEEKITAVKEKIGKWIDMLKGEYDHISSQGSMTISVKTYFPSDSENFGSFIHKLFRDRIEIASPCGIRYSMVDTIASARSIKYEQLIEEDVNMLYEHFFKKK